jgi:nucleoside phosphorylase
VILPPVNFVVALPAEAKPIAAFFDLRRQAPHGDFPVYRGGSVSLVVSGVGKAAAAAATEFLHGLDGAQDKPIWINLGIAGHGDLPIGEALLARSITDAASGSRWHPPLMVDLPLRTENLITLDQPAFDYGRSAAFDMEASGFLPTALRFTRPELVHCFKVVSDNRDSPAGAINRKRVSAWISQQQNTLALLLQRLNDVRETL